MLETEQQPKNLIENPQNQGNIRDKKGRFIPGVSGNPGGKPEGTLSFQTKWRIFIDKVAKQNNITPDEVDEQLLAVAFKQAKEANYPFWRDIHDRVYGTAQQNIKHQGELTISTVLDELEDGQAPNGQTVESKPLIQDTEQRGEASTISAQ